MSLQEEELVSSHAGQPEQASSLLDQIMAQTRIQPGSEGYDVARQGVTAFIASILQSTASAEPVNKLAVDSMIADIDERISRQMDVIIHAPAYQQVESFWRSLKTMVDRVDFRENIKVNVLHVTKQELLEDFEFAPEIIQSGFYKHVYSSGFGQFGGEPIAAVLGAYEFKNTAPDMKLLQYVSAVGAMAHAPYATLSGNDSPAPTCRHRGKRFFCRSTPGTSVRKPDYHGRSAFRHCGCPAIGTAVRSGK